MRVVPGLKWLIVYFIVVILICPDLNDGFKFKDFNSPATTGVAGRKSELLKKPLARNVKPFRILTKIEQIDDDDDDDDDDDNDDGDENNIDDDEDTEDNDEKMNISEDNEDDDEDEDDNNENEDDNRKPEEDKDEGEEDEEENNDLKYKFEKVRKTDYTNLQSPKTRTSVKDDKKRSQTRTSKKHGKDDESDGSESSFFSSFFEFLTFSSNDESKDSKEKEKPSPTPTTSKTTSEESSNGIIEFLKGFTSNSIEEKESSTRKSSKKDDDNWMNYLNRWPFNVFFEFDKKSSSSSGKSSKKRSKASIADENAEVNEAKPLTQEEFEELLYKLPNFILNPAKIEDIECKKQALVFQRQLRGLKLWTLQMMDSTAKISPGILRGNPNQFGDFDICTHIKTSVKISSEYSIRIKGKYCLINVEMQHEDDNMKLPLYLAKGRGLWNSHLDNPTNFIPRYTVFNWGLCVPDSCPVKEIQNMIENNLIPYNSSGISFQVDLKEEDCHVRKTKSFKTILLQNWEIAFTLIYFGTFLSLVILATTIDYWYIVDHYNKKIFQTISGTVEKSDDNRTDNEELEEKNEDESNEKPNEDENQTEQEVEAFSKNHKESLLRKILLSFSLKKTFAELVQVPSENVTFIHILRIICTVGLYISMKFLMIGHLPISNRDRLVRTLSNPLSIFIRSPFIFFDTLLLISGFISSRQMYDEIELKSTISIVKRLTWRFLRYLPTLYAILLFQTWILPLIGSGPLWGRLIDENSEICKRHLWRNFFTAQNAINFEETCSPMSIQLAVELQLYLLTPLMVWLYYNSPDVGIIVYGAFHAISASARFSRTNLESLSPVIFHGINVSKFYRTANLLFSSPIPRATAYLIGIGLGILLKSGSKSTEIPKIISIFGWIISFLGCLWCFWYPSNNMRIDFIYNSSDAAAYSSWSPIILSFCLGWMIFMLIEKENDPNFVSKLNTSNLLKPILILSKISYPIQIIMYVVIIFSTAEIKETIRFELGDLINVKEALVIISFAIILALFIDLPFRNIRRLFITKMLLLSSDEGTNLTENQSDGKNTEKEDPIEDIWGSDEKTDEEVTTFTFRKKSIEYEKQNGKQYDSENEKTESADESWRTESDLDQYKNYDGDDGDDEEEEKHNDDQKELDDDDEEEDDEITEEDEIVRRPDTPSPVLPRRRWNLDKK